MGVTMLSCERCGAALTLYQPANRATCDYCGANYLISDGNNATQVPSAGSFGGAEAGYVISRYGDDSPLKVCADSDFDHTKRALCWVSGMAFLLKRSYVIEPFELRGDGTEGQGSVRGGFTDNYVKYNPVRDRRGRVKGWDREPVFVEECLYNKQVREERASWLESHSVPVKDEMITGFKSSKDEDNRRSGISYFERDLHTLVCTPPLITPNHFPTFFSDVEKRYRQVSALQEASAIAAQLADLLNYANNGRPHELSLLFSCSEYDCSFSVNGGSLYGEQRPNAVSVSWQDVGMANLPKDFVTSMAVMLAVMGSLLNTQALKGRHMLDIDASCPVMRPPFNNHFYGYFVVKWQESWSKSLKSW